MEMNFDINAHEEAEDKFWFDLQSDPGVPKFSYNKWDDLFCLYNTYSEAKQNNFVIQPV